jgi:hypothetical protein
MSRYHSLSFLDFFLHRVKEGPLVVAKEGAESLVNLSCGVEPVDLTREALKLGAELLEIVEIQSRLGRVPGTQEARQDRTVVLLELLEVEAQFLKSLVSLKIKLTVT